MQYHPIFFVVLQEIILSVQKVRVESFLLHFANLEQSCTELN